MGRPETKYEILIIYYSRFGVVKLLAERVAEGAMRVDGVTACLLEVEERPIEELRDGESEQTMELRRAVTVNQRMRADGIIVGSPAYLGSMASPVKRLFEDCVTASAPPVSNRSRLWRQHWFRDKVGAAFTSSGTPHGGNEQTLHSILTMMMHLGMIIVTPGQQEPILEHAGAPYGATAISCATGQKRPTREDQKAARDLGQRVAEVTAWISIGRYEWELGGAP